MSTAGLGQAIPHICIGGLQVIKDKEMTVGLAWSPEGDEIAVAGQANDVRILRRRTWELKQNLAGGHDSPVCFISYSANGGAFFLEVAFVAECKDWTYNGLRSLIRS